MIHINTTFNHNPLTNNKCKIAQKKKKFPCTYFCSYLEGPDAGKEPLRLEVEEDEEGVGVVRHLVAHAAAAHAVPLAEVPQEHQQGTDAAVEFLKIQPFYNSQSFKKPGLLLFKIRFFCSIFPLPD